MKDTNLAIGFDSSDADAAATAHIEQLARETNMPIDVVQKVYSSEHMKLERSARIKTYVPVLVHRHVKARLREQCTPA